MSILCVWLPGGVRQLNKHNCVFLRVPIFEWFSGLGKLCCVTKPPTSGSVLVSPPFSARLDARRLCKHDEHNLRLGSNSVE